VLTGGGSQLKHIKQLVEYITGMDTRIGYPNEHLAGNSDEEISSPLYATAVGLVMNSIRNNTMSATPLVELQKPAPEPEYRPQPVQQPAATTATPPPVFEHEEEEEMETVTAAKPKAANVQESTEKKVKRSFFDKYIDRIKDFLDNAE
jgi:cell division protein FtsA